MSARRSQSAPRGEISPVLYDTAQAAPLALKYPNGLLMNAHPAHLELVKRAARESETRVFIVCGGAKLLVYFTVDGLTSSVPTLDPTAFFDCFQRLQIERMQKETP